MIMEKLWIYITLALTYGVVCSGVYTWLSPRRVGTWRLMLRSLGWFTAAGAFLAWIFYLIFK